MRRKPLLLTSLLVVTLLPLSSYLYRQLSRPALAAPSAETLALQQAVTIYRDELGVPHIHGQTDNAVAFGFAFAHSEDDFPTIQGSLAAARGQLGLLLPGELAGANDFLVQLLDVQRNAHTQFDELPADFQAYLNAYAAGLNYYAYLHPDEADSRLFPLSGVDVVAGFNHKLPLMMGVGSALQNLFSFTPEQLQVGQPVERKLDQVPELPDWFSGRLAGSNAHAVKRQRSSDDVTRLNINSHQPWEGPVAWYEAHLISDQGMNILGGTFPGAPVILHGHNNKLGWAHTVNRPDMIDLYKLTVRENPALEYQLDGQWLPLREHNAAMTLDLKVFDWTVNKSYYESEHGPVVKLDSGDYYAVRFPGRATQGKAVYQWYLMDKAQSLSQWQAAMGLQYLSMMNTLYADRDNIFYVYNALLPVREEGPDWRTILPGDQRSLIWQDTLVYERLPQVLNPASGLLMNTNTTPFLATDGPENPRPQDFSATLSIERVLNNRGWRTFETFGRDPQISREEFLRYKFDQRYSRDSAVFKELLEPLLANYQGQTEDERQALQQLRDWDGEMAADSTAASLVRLIEEPWNKPRLYEPLHTPVPEAVALFQAAVVQLSSDFGGISVPLTDLQKLQRGDVQLGLGGGSDTLNSVHTEQRGKYRVGTAGDSYILLVEFAADGTRSWARHQYGNVNRKDSPHYSDQAVAFQQRQLRPSHFQLADVQANAERYYHPGED